MNKKFLKFANYLFSRTWIKVVSYILGIFLILLISGVFKDFTKSFEKIASILSTQETLSVLLVGILSLGIAKFLKRTEYYLEESLKINDDHHKIIAKYNGHKKEKIKKDKNYSDKTGVFMSVSHIKALSEKELINNEKDIYTKAHKSNQEDIDSFKEGHLYLPSVNVFTNITGDAKLVFDDSSEPHKLPTFVIEHADELLLAHRNSQKRNNNTIRLNDFSYEDGVLTLHTQRSTYYHMLITNRCMDYDFSNGLSIRDLYEYDKYICPLPKSKFGNQIGINGLVITSDGYVLIEKRDHKKTTWKNKFAQSISLALKEDEMGLSDGKVLKNTYEEANEKLKGVIEKTLDSNFRLKPEEYQKFSLEKNLLGLARDLLEGGKPNLYFYVVTECTAEELADKLKEKASKKEEDEAILTDKLDSDYYLVPFSDIEINYNYIMNLNRKKAYKVYRKVHPRSKLRHYLWDKAKHMCALVFNPELKRECGEALLVTISYLELCKDRIAPLKSEK